MSDTPDPLHPDAVLPAQPAPTSDPELDAILDLIRRGIAPDADLPARALARDVCMRIVQLITLSMPPPQGGTPPFPPPPPLYPPAASPPYPPPPAASPPPPAIAPLAAIADKFRHLPPGVLRNVSRDQLVDMALHGLRASLPPGTQVTEPKGIQFSLVPVPHVGGEGEKK